MPRHSSSSSPEREPAASEPGSVRVGRTLLSLVILAGLLVLGYNFYFVCAQKQAAYEAKLAEIDALEGENAVCEQQNKILEEKVHYLGTDEGVEEVAREKLGLVRKGEVAFVVVPAPGTQQVDAPVYVPRPPARKPTLIQTFLHTLFAPGFPPPQP